MINATKSLAVLLLAAGAAAGDVGAQSRTAACTMPDTTEAWYRTQREWAQLDAKHDWSNDSLRTALIDAARRVDTSQFGAVQLGAIIDGGDANVGDTTALAPARAVLREMASKRSWPVRSVVGAEGVRAAWIVANGDTALSRMAMHRMMEAGPGESSPADVAVLEDQLRLERGRKQLYATHMVVTRDAKGTHIEPAPTEDLAHVDMRREAAGLPKLAEALCAVRARAGEQSRK